MFDLGGEIEHYIYQMQPESRDALSTFLFPSFVLLHGEKPAPGRLLYVAPETLLTPRLFNLLNETPLDCLTIDEAHCISEWGHDFRPDYLHIAEARRILGNPLTVALTATATERVRTDIVQQLHLREPRCYVASFNRPNLTYRVLAKSGAEGLLLVAAPPRASAQVADTTRLGDLVVTATRLDTPRSSLPASVTVVTGEELARRIEALMKEQAS